MRKIETTLRYDHVTDDMVREYFEKHQPELKPTDMENGLEEKQEHPGFSYIYAKD